MTFDFEQKLDNYADLLVTHGLNVQAGQVVNITGELIHRQLLQRVAAKAYRAGAKYVNIDLIDPWHARQRILGSTDPEFLTYVPPFIPAKFNEIVDTHGAVLRFQGSEEPEILADLPPEAVNNVRIHYMKSLKRYYDEGVSQSKMHWTVAAAATPKWGKRVFPELDEAAACQALWEAIFSICRVDKPNYLELWQQHNFKLLKRAQLLTELKIKELHFTGPGTDLKVFLSPVARFKGGGETGARGVTYECNIPTEECFTTPDYRLTEGHARVTRPFLVNGKLIKGLTLKFKGGRIVDFHADEGAETFRTYINSDEGACQLGEVALVGTDSPIFQSGRVFEEILYDENAACHIAVGFAYRFCLEDGPQMTPEELEALGCNTSNVHTDMMISDQEVDIHATTHSGRHLPLILKGKWQEPFA
jgi:aminopeptidase